MDTQKKSIRFGLMVDGPTVQRWQMETVKMLLDNGIELVLTIVNVDGVPQKVGVLDKIRHYQYRRILFRVWNRYFFKPHGKDIVKLDIPPGTTTINCKPLMKGISSYFTEEDVEVIKSYNMDFILRFGFDIVRGDVLKSARYGIWSFHHDDERIVRGGPPGFWEFMRHNPENGAILQQLTDSLDKGLIIKRMKINTTLHSYREHLDRLLFESEVLPLQACNELIYNGKLETTPSDSKAPIVHPPVNIQMMLYFWLCFWRRIAFHTNLLFRQEDWNVCYINEPIDAFINENRDFSKDIHWFKPSKSEYFADPFVIKTAKDTYIFFERYAKDKGKSDLAVALKSENFMIYHKISDFNEHRSYPFVFEYDGDFFCIPEAYRTGKVSLYKFDEENLKIQHDCDILSDCSMTDPTLLHNNGKWYLFVTPQQQSHTHLYIYIADDIRGPYLPHDDNPVKIDCSNSRPAGNIINVNGKLIRPAQNSATHYGQSTILNEITQLSEHQFSENKTKEILPFKGTDYDRGIHTISGNDEMTVFDAKRFSFSWKGFIQQIKLRMECGD